jgi:hypothetical protein
LTPQDAKDLKNIKNNIVSKEKNFVIGEENPLRLKAIQLESWRISRENVTKREEELYAQFLENRDNAKPSIYINKLKKQMTILGMDKNIEFDTYTDFDGVDSFFNQEESRNQRVTEKFRKLSPIIISFLLKLKDLNLTVQMLARNPVIPKIPYQLHDSKKFFVAVRMDDHYCIKEMLERNRYYVYQTGNFPP